MSTAFPWNELGIVQTRDIATIRRAYADRLKAMDPDLEAAAYTRLRAARDTALSQAKASAAPTVSAPQGAPNSPAPDMAPVVGEAVVTIIVPNRDKAQNRTVVAEGTPPVASAPPIKRHSITAEPPPPSEASDTRLVRLLLANGQGNDTPLSTAEEAEARACLRHILAAAATSDLKRHATIETKLAYLMRQSWPRCAPLLEKTANTFNWPKRAGQLDESQDVAFLNARLAGYLFQYDVRSQAHPYHNAWIELSKPGRVGIRRYLVSSSLKKKITDLLFHIRNSFPEIEDLLDSKRVASWDKTISSKKIRERETLIPPRLQKPFKIIRSFGLRIILIIICAMPSYLILFGSSHDTRMPLESYHHIPQASSGRNMLRQPDNRTGADIFKTPANPGTVANITAQVIRNRAIISAQHNGGIGRNPVKQQHTAPPDTSHKTCVSRTGTGTGSTPPVATPYDKKQAIASKTDDACR